MMALCLKKIKGLDKRVKLVDAVFIWTEPHSRRIKVKLTVQKEVFNSSIMQQTFVVEFVVANQQCPECQKSWTEHTWTHCVQVRQKVKHKRTFFFLEQQIIKHNIAQGVQSIKQISGGLDFYFLKEGGARRLIQFLETAVPCRSKESKKLISQDDHSNTHSFKYTTNVEIAPVCRGDLAVLSRRLCSSLGGISPLMLCTKVSASIHLIDPVTLKIVEITSAMYWRDPFGAAMSQGQLTEYVVLDVEADSHDQTDYNRKSAYSQKVSLAEVTVARACDLGVNDIQIKCLSHLGGLLKAGDNVLGYDVKAASLPDAAEFSSLKGRQVADVVLVRKTYPKKNRAARRNWRLRNLNIEGPEKALKKSEQEIEEQEYERFLQEVEEDPEAQKSVNIYRKRQEEKKVTAPVAAVPVVDSDDEGELPGITNMLEDVNLADAIELNEEGEDDDGDTPIDFTNSEPV
jgi:nonsense-mediated mRNA decay protein 3